MPTSSAYSSPDRSQVEDFVPDPNRWKALAVCLLGGAMVLLDVSIVNVALRSISLGLHASGDALQWVLSGYSLTFGLLLVPAGRLGDTRGRRRMFLIGLVLFTLTSLLCGAAPNATWLVIARLSQGLAAGLLTPQISALIQQLFRGRERGKAFGLFGAMVGISTALGPLIGGLLIQLFGESDGWRYVFFVNLPIGLVTVPFALRLLPQASDEQRGRRHDLDPVGVLLLGAGVVVLLLPFVQEQQWHGSAKWLLVPLAALLLAGFVAWEARYRRAGRESLVDLALFGRRSFSFGTSMITVYFAGFTALFFVLTLLLQFGLGYSALLAGLTTLPFAVGSGLAAGVSGRVVHRFGRRLVLLGLVLVTLGYLGVIGVVREVPEHLTGWVLIAPLLIGGIGSGMVIAPNQTLTLSEVPVSQGGTAGGLIQVGQRIGSAIGIAAVGSVFYAQLAASHGNYNQALQHGLLIAVLFLVLALVLAAADLLVRDRATGADLAGDGARAVA
ncbi:MFS transporter [Jatrophihabitans sp.]|uniref:MFS transporter n=1 Tax=Jatrophihabitans sp. TaxID=1932789 RepID=UPI002CC787B6|nr:MFS transporter [Jatrophihabitans sp.]